MRKSEPRHDSEGARKLCAALRGTGSVAHSDKSLAAGNKCADGWHTYKTRHFKPGTGTRANGTNNRNAHKKTRPDWHGKRP